MKIAVLSGKGGAGKTFVATNLAYSIGSCTYVDCDVEEPNGRLFLKPQVEETETVTQKIPRFDPNRCTGCRECVTHCHFNALLYIKDKPMIFPEVCHNCGLCSLVCHENAISEEERPIGQLEIGNFQTIRVITGILNPGEASGIPVIQAAQEKASLDQAVIIDCPPGSACSVQESVRAADFCILVAEPTAFGFDNFKMVQTLVSHLKKPYGVIINKMGILYEPLETYCLQNKIPILMRIPFDKTLASRISQGELVSVSFNDLRNSFREVFLKAGGMRL